MLLERENLEKQIEKIQNQLRSLPAGKLICTRNGSHFKWLKSDGKTSTYIPKRERKLAEKLAVKRYLTVLMETLQKEKHAVDMYLKYAENANQSINKMFKENSGYQELLEPHLQSLSEELKIWETDPYEKNLANPEHLIYSGVLGHRLRSKTEVIIEMLLHKNNIPFQYESALHLGNTTVFPDFTIRHPQTGKYFYWEHFGMMKHPEYIKKMSEKLFLYSSNGIIPTIHLIMTCETKEHPLSPSQIQNIIDQYFMKKKPSF